MGRAFFEPSTTDEALQLLANETDAAVVAGGTDLVVADRSGKKPLPRCLISIRRLEELAAVTSDGRGGLRVGALVTQAELEAHESVRARYSSLADAAALIGSPATRNVATLGGNLCNGSPAMETGSPLLTFDAIVELRSADRVRTLALDAFVLGPGETALDAGELLTAVILPPLADRLGGSAYVRLEYRRAMEIAIAGVAARLVLDGGRVSEARLALTAVAPTCVRARAAEAELVDRKPTEPVLVRAGRLAAEAAAPIDDVRGPARYRRAMIEVIARRALELAHRRALGETIDIPAQHADDAAVARIA